MTDILVQHISADIVTRIEALAAEREWPANEVILRALRFGLGLGGDAFTTHERQMATVVELDGQWDDEETAAFDDALTALADAVPDRHSGAAKSP